MRYVKLFLISVVVFGVILFCLSLLFPSTTYVSRAVNVRGEKSTLNSSMPELYLLAFQDNEDSIKKLKLLIDSLTPKDYELRKENKITSGTYIISLGDTLMFSSPFSTDIKQAIAVYEAGKDSSTVQVFYKIQVPFYKPWKKFALMLNETKYGPSLDSAINRIHAKF
jgi:hypothetical protein